MRDDDALAPVVAVMLILAVIVTFLSIWNAVVLPSMKQSAEAYHLRDVESAFRHFSSDIEKAVCLRQDNLVFSEPVPLGGGDVMFDPVRSGGSLAVDNGQKPAYSVTLYDETGTALGQMNGTLVSIVYEPLGNFWQDQGYRWQEGYINVTKYRNRQTPLDFYNMTDVVRESEGNGALAAFAGSFVAAEHTRNESAIAGNCSSVSLVAVNLTASPAHQYTSGNGYGTLRVKTSTQTTAYTNVAYLLSVSGRDLFGNATIAHWNSSLSAIARECESNVRYRPDYSGSFFSGFSVEQQVSPVQVLLKTITLEIGAY